MVQYDGKEEGGFPVCSAEQMKGEKGLQFGGSFNLFYYGLNGKMNEEREREMLKDEYDEKELHCIFVELKSMTSYRERSRGSLDGREVQYIEVVKDMY